ncbi:hypothetical protein F4826_000686 [Rahnella inusitata]|nr:hypothetical protein [Rahnella inusitata]
MINRKTDSSFVTKLEQTRIRIYLWLTMSHSRKTPVKLLSRMFSIVITTVLFAH